MMINGEYDADAALGLARPKNAARNFCSFVQVFSEDWALLEQGPLVPHPSEAEAKRGRGVAVEDPRLVVTRSPRGEDKRPQLYATYANYGVDEAPFFFGGLVKLQHRAWRGRLGLYASVDGPSRSAAIPGWRENPQRKNLGAFLDSHDRLRFFDFGAVQGTKVGVVDFQKTENRGEDKPPGSFLRALDGNLHNSINPIPLANGNLLCFVHEYLYHGGGVHPEKTHLPPNALGGRKKRPYYGFGYLQYAIELASSREAEETYRIVRRSPPFVLPAADGGETPEAIQLVTSGWLDDRNQINLAYGINDCQQAVVSVPWAALDTFLDAVPEK